MSETEKSTSGGLLSQVTIGVLVGLIVAMIVKEK